jgi:hypothetical protein
VTIQFPFSLERIISEDYIKEAEWIYFISFRENEREQSDEIINNREDEII